LFRRELTNRLLHPFNGVNAQELERLPYDAGRQIAQKQTAFPELSRFRLENRAIYEEAAVALGQVPQVAGDQVRQALSRRSLQRFLEAEQLQCQSAFIRRR